MKKIEKLIYTNERGESVEFSHASIFHSNDISGLNDVRNEIYSFNSMGQDGDTYLGNRIESREIEIVGSINARGKENTITNRRRLSHVLNPQLNAVLRYEYGDFVRVIDCKVDNAPVFTKETIFLGFTVQLLCLDPFWREEAETRDDIASWVGALEFEVEIPEETGIEFGYREPSLIVNVYNGGDVKSGMRIDFRAIGTVTDPKLLNVDTGEFINFEGLDLVAGDILTVSTYYGKKQITLTRNGITEDAFRYLDVDSTYMQLALGDNLFRYDAAESVEALEVSIYHNNKYLGV